MSIHKSLKLKNTLARQRSVLNRWERIAKLKEAERWKEGDSVLGLPKVRTKFKIRVRKGPKPETAEGATPAAGAAAPAKAAPAKAAAEPKAAEARSKAAEPKARK